MLGWIFGLVGLGGQRLEAGEEAKANEVKALYTKLKVATSYEEWQGVAERLDELEGAREWKRDPSSPFYDSNLIQQRVEKFRELIEHGDIQTMMFRLRVGLNRNLGGIGAPELFDRTHVGTKELIEEHREQLITMFCAVRDAPEETISLDKRVAFFSEARHAFGKTALVLSGGASLGMYHMGVVKALLEQGLLPRIISGSNAGAIVASWCCTRTSDELVSVFAGGARSVAEAMSGNLGFNPVGSLERKLRRALQTGHLMDVQKLKNALQKHIGDVTFHEAYERTGRILNITVSPGSDYEKPRLLNYLTAPTVLIWSAASASCALPGLYEAVELLSKTPKGDHVPYQTTNVKWVDGTLGGDLPMNRLQELFNVNYMLVSQTNPHAIPFVQQAQRQLHPDRHLEGKKKGGLMSRAATALFCLAKFEVIHRCEQAIQLGLAPKLLALTLNQKYIGDVTIVPPVTLSGYKQVISNPTPEAFEEFVRVGEQRTWPNISLIRSQCKIEIVLDDCVRKVAEAARERDERAHLERRGDSLGNQGGHPTPRPSRNRHTHLDLNTFFQGAREEGADLAEDEGDEDDDDGQSSNPGSNPGSSPPRDRGPQRIGGGMVRGAGVWGSGSSVGSVDGQRGGGGMTRGASVWGSGSSVGSGDSCGSVRHRAREREAGHVPAYQDAGRPPVYPASAPRKGLLSSFFGGSA